MKEDLVYILSSIDIPFSIDHKYFIRVKSGSFFKQQDLPEVLLAYLDYRSREWITAVWEPYTLFTNVLHALVNNYCKD